MIKYSSGTTIILKTGGPKMKVRWYVDDKHLEASWYEDNQEVSGIFAVADIESCDGNSPSDIEVILVMVGAC